MDKIDVVLFRFKREKTFSKKCKKMRRLTLIPMTILLLTNTILTFAFLLGYVWSLILSIICLILMEILAKIMEGKWGTNKWKDKWVEVYHDNFNFNQEKLVAIINGEGMNCQQVYNFLIKRHSRMLHKVDKQTFIITIFSLVIAFTSILVSPLQNTSFEIYTKYIIKILFFLAPMAYILYKFIIAQSKDYDKKKNDYECVIKLLEDYLY